ncbi:MAG: peptide ABC transporter substrate-binding protein [Bdellovibrionota bacterium]
MKIIMLLLMILGVASPKSLTAASNNELKIGITQEFENLNPIVAQMAASTYIRRAVGRNLVDMDENGKYYPALIVKIPTLENGLARLSGEGKNRKIVAEWQIKDNAKWGDGKPVTGYDVEFTWTVALSKFVSVGERDTYHQIEKFEIDKANPKKFKTYYREAHWDFNQLLTFPVVPKHLEENIFKKFGNVNEGYAKNSLHVKDPTNPGLYNGPYKVTEVKLGSHVIIERNKYFYGEPAKIKKIIFKVIPNSGTLEANLRSGNIDMISTLGLPFDQALVFAKKVEKEKLPYKVKFKPGLLYEHIDLQLKNPILQDLNVRKALVYGLNRTELTKALFEGKQAPAIHNVAPMDVWYTDNPKDITLYPHSRRQAKKLLDSSGWKMAKDGYRWKNGKKLSLQIMTTAGNKARELVETYLQAEWKKIGVEILIKNEPGRVFFGETVRKGKYPALAMYAWISSPESTPRSTFHSKSIPTKENGYSGQNSMGWSNPKVDAAIDAIDVEFDAQKRIKLAHRILGYYTDEVPVIPLFYRSDVAVIPNKMSGHKMNGHQAPNTNHVEYWTFK